MFKSKCYLEKNKRPHLGQWLPESDWKEHRANSLHKQCLVLNKWQANVVNSASREHAIVCNFLYAHTIS